MQASANNQRHAQPLCLRLPSSLESLLYLLHSCCSELTVPGGWDALTFHF